MNSQLSFLFFVIALFLICISCDTTNPPDNKSLTLKLKDVSCTEIWIELATTNLQLPAEIDLKQNNNVVKTINLVKADTLVYINSLLPNTPHTFQAVNEANRVKSNTVNVTTLDTTSQNFSFEILEFGDGFESSYFNDVWVFDENNIWAVGYISPSDTVVNGTPIINPNIIRWNGIKWELEPFDGTSSGINGIWAANQSKIYFANGIVLKYENGNYQYEDFSNVPLPNGQRVEKLWGSSESNIYGVGPWGTIVWYNGVQWTKIEFDMQWYFYQITGNKQTGVAYAIARNANHVTGIVELNNSMANIIYNSQESQMGFGSWTIHFESNKLFLSQGNIWSFNPIKKDVKELIKLPTGLGVLTISSYKGNDIYYFGDEGSEARLIHFNGLSYKIFNIPQIDPDNYGGIHAINNLAVSVGFTNNKAYIIKIRR